MLSKVEAKTGSPVFHVLGIVYFIKIVQPWFFKGNV